MKFLFFVLALSLATPLLVYGTWLDVALVKAIESGDTALVEDILVRRRGQIDINMPDICGKTYLCQAVENGHTEIVKLLIKQGAHFNDIHRAYLDPIFHVLAYSHSEMKKILLDTGIDVNAQDDLQYDTHLHWTADDNFNGRVKLLLDAGANVTIKNLYGKTPLDSVKESIDFDRKYHGGSDVNEHDLMCVKLLLEDYAELVKQIKIRPTKELLNHALRYGYVHAVKLLLKAGIKPDAQDLALVKQEYNRDARPLYKESYATIGRMLLQHLRLSGELQAPEIKRTNIAKLLAFLKPAHTNNTESAYGAIAKSGIAQVGLPENAIQAIASYTY